MMKHCQVSQTERGRRCDIRCQLFIVMCYGEVYQHRLRLLTGEIFQLLCFQTVRVKAFPIKAVFQRYQKSSVPLCHLHMMT